VQLITCRKALRTCLISACRRSANIPPHRWADADYSPPSLTAAYTLSGDKEFAANSSAEAAMQGVSGVQMGRYWGSGCQAKLRRWPWPQKRGTERVVLPSRDTSSMCVTVRYAIH